MRTLTIGHRAAVYARLSQDRSGQSPNCQIQEDEARDYAEEHGWDVVAVFTDDDISASRYSTKPRPGYNRLLEAIRASEIDVILCTEMQRLYRRLEELLGLIHLSEQTSLSRIETTDGFGYDLSTGEGIHNAVSAVNNAVLESRRTSDRIKRKRRAEAKDGKAHGGARPFGYEKGGMVIREDEAEVIRGVVRALLAGRPLGSIVIDLNASGIPAAKGGLWHPRNLIQILSSKRIMGIRTHHGTEYPAAWPAITTAEEWERVQLVLQGSAHPLKGKRPTSYLLSGMVYCGICGKKLASSGTQEAQTRRLQRKYRCRHRDNSGAVVGCGKIVRQAEPVELLVTEAVLYRYDSPQLAEALTQTNQPEMQSLVTAYHGHKAKLDDLVEDYASGLLNRQQLAQAKAVVEEAMEGIKSKMAKLEAGRVIADIPVGQTVREAWKTRDLDWKRSMIGLVVEKVILLPGRPGRRTWQPKDGSGKWVFDYTKVQIQWRVSRGREELAPPG